MDNPADTSYPSLAYYQSALRYPVYGVSDNSPYPDANTRGAFPSVADCNSGVSSPGIYNYPGGAYTDCSGGDSQLCTNYSIPSGTEVCEPPGTRIVYLPPSGFAGTKTYNMSLAQINYGMMAGSLGVSTSTNSATQICQHFGHTDVVPGTGTLCWSNFYGHLDRWNPPGRGT